MHRSTDLASLADQFRSFATFAGRDDAPLYRIISAGVAGDDDLLRLLLAAPVEQRRPQLLLAAVHYLLLGGADSPLGAGYPTVADWRRHAGGRSSVASDGVSSTAVDTTPDTLVHAFRAFCHRYHAALEALLATRAVQTNEVGRCTALLPALSTIAAAADQPLSLIDLGASAGLNLLLDRFAYEYRRPAASGATSRSVVHRAGDPASPLLLEAELRSGELPDLTIPPIAHRAGVDQHPVDPDQADESLWLLACQWPDHLGRFHRLATALALARTIGDRARVMPGDVVDDLPDLVAGAPPESHVCIVHSWVAAYLSSRRQEELAAAVAAIAAQRSVSWLFAENPYEVPRLPVPQPSAGTPARGATALVLVESHGGRLEARRLADLHPHGRWLRWWDAPP